MLSLVMCGENFIEEEEYQALMKKKVGVQFFLFFQTKKLNYTIGLGYKKNQFSIFVLSEFCMNCNAIFVPIFLKILSFVQGNKDIQTEENA